MSLIFNMVGGGGQSEGPIENGTIVVTYPAGATCTVTNGSQTYTALDTSGAAAFVVDPGEWTVTAVQVGETASESVTVTAGGWVEVELSFYTYLIRNGVDNTAVTGGIKDVTWGQSSAIATVKGTQNRALRFGVESYNQNLFKLGAATKNLIDITNINTLIVTFKAAAFAQSYSASGGAVIDLVVDNSTNSESPAVSLNLAARGTTAKTTQNVDVSGLSGSYYVGIWATVYGSPPTTCYADIYDLKYKEGE